MHWLLFKSRAEYILFSPTVYKVAVMRNILLNLPPFRILSLDDLRWNFKSPGQSCSKMSWQLGFGQSVTLIVPRPWQVREPKTRRNNGCWVHRKGRHFKTLDAPLQYRLTFVPKMSIILWVIYCSSRICLTCVFSRQFGGNLQCCCQVPHLDTTKNIKYISICFQYRTFYGRRGQLLSKKS